MISKDTAIPVSYFPEYARQRYDGKCVKPVNVPPPPSMELPMCGNPATHVSVRNDGWVSGVTWCTEHVNADNSHGGYRDGFTWHPIDQ